MKKPSHQPPCGRRDFCFLCQHLPDAWERIKERSFEVEYDPNQDVFTEGDPPDRLIAVCQGMVLLFHSRPNGDRLVFRIARAGEALGLAAVLWNEPYAFSAQTLAPTRLRMLARSAWLAELDAEPGWWKPVALEGARRHLATLAEVKKPSLVRAIELVLSFGPAPPAEPAAYRVPLTVRELAASVGVSERTIWRYLAQWREKKWLARPRGWLVVSDPPRLRHYLEEIRQRGRRRAKAARSKD